MKEAAFCGLVVFAASVFVLGNNYLLPWGLDLYSTWEAAVSFQEFPGENGDFILEKGEDSDLWKIKQVHRNNRDERRSLSVTTPPVRSMSAGHSGIAIYYQFSQGGFIWDVKRMQVVGMNDPRHPCVKALFKAGIWDYSEKLCLDLEKKTVQADSELPLCTPELRTQQEEKSLRVGQVVGVEMRRDPSGKLELVIVTCREPWGHTSWIEEVRKNKNEPTTFMLWDLDPNDTEKTRTRGVTLPPHQ